MANDGDFSEQDIVKKFERKMTVIPVILIILAVFSMLNHRVFHWCPFGCQYQILFLIVLMMILVFCATCPRCHKLILLHRIRHGLRCPKCGTRLISDKKRA